MSPRPTELLLIIGFELLIYGCVQHLKRRLPLRQITFRNKFGVLPQGLLSLDRTELLAGAVNH